MKRLIIIRGNSASGKTTVARELQERLGRTTMLLSQDTLRREILRAKDTTNHPGGKLLQLVARFGWENGYDSVIVEGIWSKKKYGEQLHELIREADKARLFYFDIPFDDTVRRHGSKPVAGEYGEAELRGWWLQKDYLGAENEVILDETYSKEMIVEKILKELV